MVDRGRRAALPAEERAFWAIVISLTLSLVVVLGLAAAGVYRFERLLLINLTCCLAIAALYGGRLRLGPGAPRPGWLVLVPVALVLLGLWRFFPPAEYVLGGRDPGVYMSEGIQIAQRSSLLIQDRVVGSLPTVFHDLFFTTRGYFGNYGSRFMGFFILDPGAGTVVAQFLHLYPASIAIAYGLDGLTGARRCVGFWGILGLLTFYFAGAARLVGRAAAAAAAALLGVNVVQVWFARIPNAELAMQALLFAALLATARAHVDEDRFFGLVGGALFGLLIFVHLSAVLALVAVAAAAVISLLDGRRPSGAFIVLLALGLGVGVPYLAIWMAPYVAYPVRFVQDLQPLHFSLIALGGLLILALAFAARFSACAGRAHVWVPAALIFVVLTAAGYAYFLRSPAGRLAPHDAMALRTISSYYLSVPGLVAALAGYTLIVRRRFWRDPTLILTVTIFAFFFFYKIRITPEHFWMARRFLPIILPGALLFASAAAFAGLETKRQGLRAMSVATGVVFVALLGRYYVLAAMPVLDHIEYAGVIPRLEGCLRH